MPPILKTEVVRSDNPPRDLAPQAVDFETLSDFMDSLQGISWQNTTLYLYQKEPDVTKVTGEPAYVKRYKEPIDEEEVRRVAPEGRRFMLILKTDKLAGQRAEPPKRFFFSVSQTSTGGVHVAGNAQVAVSGTDPQALKTIERLSVVGIDQVTQAANLSSNLLANTFQLAMTKAINPQPAPDPAAVFKGFTEGLVNLKTLGLMGEEKKPDVEALAQRIESALTKQAPAVAPPPTPNLGEQFKSFIETAALMGFSRPGSAPAEKSIKTILAENAGTIVNGLNSLAEKVLAIVTIRAGAPPVQQATEPAAAEPAAQARSGQRQIQAAPANQPKGEQTVEEFLKSKILEFYQAGAQPDQTVAWVIVAAPGIIKQMAAFELPAVIAWLSSDPILKPLAEASAKKWVTGFLEAAKMAVQAAQG